jgi:hypothetical protein
VLLAPEDGGGVVVYLVEEVVDVAAGLGEVVLVEIQVAVSPVL